MSPQSHQELHAGLRQYTILVVGLAVTSVALQIASLSALRNSFWGWHLFAFLSPGITIASFVALLVAAFAFLRPASSSVRPDAGRVNDRVVPVVVVLSVVCGGLFWFFRSGQTLLGDAQPLITDLPRGTDFHPRQPLTMWLQHFLYQNVEGMFRGQGVSDVDVARNVVALGSVVAGALFVPTVVVLGRALCRDTSQGRRVSWLVASILVCQGYSVLFFGYIENYTLYALVLAAYLMTSLLYLQSRLPLFVVMLVFALALGVHLSSFALLPSLGFLVWWGLTDAKRRNGAIAAVGVGVGSVVMLAWVLGTIQPGFSLWDGIAEITRIARKSQGGDSGVSYTFSSVHVRDFLNEHQLIGPLGAFLFVPGLVLALGSRKIRTPVALFLTLAAGSFLVGSWMMSEPQLGYARDWDLFAPAGVCYTAAGLYFLLLHAGPSPKTARLLGFGLILSILHVAPWVAINHSEKLSLERFKTLPLGQARTEVVVGNYYFRNNDLPKAKEWFRKGLEVNPYNANIYSFLARILEREGRYDLAWKAYENAVALRPDKVSFRSNYTFALLRVDRHNEAFPQLQWLVSRRPYHLGYLRELVETARTLGREDEIEKVNAGALEAIEQALAASPNDEHTTIDAGLLLASLNRRDEAMQKFHSALEMYPNSLAGIFNSAFTLQQLDALTKQGCTTSGSWRCIPTIRRARRFENNSGTCET